MGWYLQIGNFETTFGGPKCGKCGGKLLPIHYISLRHWRCPNCGKTY
jgi:tRNA(Ile2) C34 agmatinyltransferase TiaS